MITDYASLSSAVQTWAARRDSTFVNQIPTFVDLAEARIYHGTEGDDATNTAPLRSKAMEAVGSVTMTAGVGSLPDDALDVRRVWATGNRDSITFMAPDRFLAYQQAGGSGSPVYYTVEAGQITTAPAMTGTLSLSYYKQFSAVTPTSTNDVLLQAHGTIYLEACLFEAFSFLQEGELATAHLVKLRGLIKGANRTGQALRHPGQLRVRPRVVIGA